MSSIVAEIAVGSFQNKMALRKFVSILSISLLVACGILPDVRVWLRRADFEVDPKANNGEAFECHITVAYSKDVFDRLQGMDARGYFTSVDSLRKTYKDSIEIFSFDIIPGKNKLDQKIKLKSYSKAQGAFIFAKYSASGRFAEAVGSSSSIVVRFLSYKMEVTSEASLDAITGKISTNKG